MNAARKPFRVLFVCMGNICRSPAAEIVQIPSADLAAATVAGHARILSHP